MFLARQATRRNRATNRLKHPIPLRSLVVRHLRQSLRVPTADNLEEAVQLLAELVRASLANSRADRDLIVAEDLEEDLAAAAAAEAAAAEEMAMATKSTTWTARPGTKPATDDFLSRPPSLPSRRRRRCKSFRATTARRAGRCGARR